MIFRYPLIILREEIVNWDPWDFFSFGALKFSGPRKHVHDVLNVFMCTGFTKDTHQYFMKASPVCRGEDMGSHIFQKIGVSYRVVPHS